MDAGSDGMLTVQVTDNGTGIPEVGRRSGLRNLASRAVKLGGGTQDRPSPPGRVRARYQAGMARAPLSGQVRSRVSRGRGRQLERLAWADSKSVSGETFGRVAVCYAGCAQPA